MVLSVPAPKFVAVPSVSFHFHQALLSHSEMLHGGAGSGPSQSVAVKAACPPGASKPLPCCVEMVVSLQLLVHPCNLPPG